MPNFIEIDVTFEFSILVVISIRNRRQYKIIMFYAAIR